MEPLQFAYWLQGFSELTEGQPTPEQWQSIKEHLATVFRKVTPPVHLGGAQWVSPMAAPYTPPLRADCISTPNGIGVSTLC